MLTSIQTHYSNVNDHDAENLIRFFEAIGLQRRGTYLSKHSALFSAPLGAIGINTVSELPAKVGHRLVIGIANPDVIFQIAQKLKFRVLENSAPSNTPARFFTIELAGGIVLDVVGGPPEPPSAVDGKLDATGKRFAIVVSRFNAFITERLLHGALDALRRTGAKTKSIVRVPGAFEIPLAARRLAETKKYDAIICIGCLLRGDTAHYDVIVNEVTRGIGQSAQETGVPHAFGVLTCETLEQAIDRAGLKMGNEGFEAALTAVEMASLKTVLGSPHSTAGKKVVGRSPLAIGKSGKRKSRSGPRAKRKR
jgi:6,7-dimethyl-8-ribityllumazine synthase